MRKRHFWYVVALLVVISIAVILAVTLYNIPAQLPTLPMPVPLLLVPSCPLQSEPAAGFTTSMRRHRRNPIFNFRVEPPADTKQKNGGPFFVFCF